MQISVGAKLLVELGGMEERRISCDLQGWKVNTFLLASVPFFAGIRDYMEIGRLVTCRYVHEGTVYGFKSKILGYTTNPDSLVYLSYPKAWESLELRKQQRVPCFFPARFILDGQIIEGVINDITVSGCRIQCGPSKEEILGQLRLGTKVQVKFFPFGNSVSYCMDTVLANAAMNSNQLISIGFRLVEPEADLVELINQHVTNINRHSL